MLLKMIRLLGRIILAIIARVEIKGLENVPPAGHACIMASNHIGRLDAMLVFILAERDDIIMFVADKYKSSAVWSWFVKHLDAVWLDREGLDLHAFRAARKRLNQGELLAIAPEGTRSKQGILIQGKAGTAWLAAKTNVPIVPVGITGTEDAVVKQRLRKLRRLDICAEIGEPFQLPPMDRSRRDEYLESATTEIMCQIGALLPPSYHGYYANDPRLRELLGAAPMNRARRLPS